MWALLPVVAATRLGLGSGGYGLLLGMVGIGAVAGAVVIPRVRAKVGSARLVTGAMVVTALAIAVVATVGNPVVVGLALVPIGGSWIAVMSSLNSGLQWPCPTGCGPAAWPTTWSCSRAPRRWGRSSGEPSRPHLRDDGAARGGRAAGGGAVVGLESLPDTSTLDRTPSAHWPAPQLTISPTPTTDRSW